MTPGRGLNWMQNASTYVVGVFTTNLYFSLTLAAGRRICFSLSLHRAHWLSTHVLHTRAVCGTNKERQSFKQSNELSDGEETNPVLKKLLVAFIARNCCWKIIFTIRFRDISNYVKLFHHNLSDTVILELSAYITRPSVSSFCQVCKRKIRL